MAVKFQDIHTSKRKVTRNIERAKARSDMFKKPLKEKKSIIKTQWSFAKTKIPKIDRAGFSSRRFALWSIAIVSVLFLIFSFTGLFAGATIKVTPKQEKSIIDGVFSLSQEEKKSGLLFEVMILAEEKSMDIEATKEQQVDRKAAGEIVVYNSYSSSPQRLIKNTRFEAPDGKIYRIKNSIVVPGMRVKDGKNTPGSVDVVVYADEPGEEYNRQFSDFTIPGFKGDPRYKDFYARSKSEIKNGFSGIVRVPSDNAVSNARETLRNELKKTLTEQVYTQKPEGFVAYKDGIFITYDDNDNVTNTSKDVATVTERATLHGIIFKEDVLAKFIAEQTLASYEGEDIKILNLKDLDFKIIDKENSSPLKGDLKASISGNVNIVWVIDDIALSKALTGVPKKQFQDVLAQFPYIQRAEATIRPFWKRTLPDEAKNIKIEQIIE